MKTITLNVSYLFFMLTILFFSCEKDVFNITPSSQVTSEYHQISDFDQLNISDAFQAYIEFSDTEQLLRIEANENLHELIEVKQNNGKLSIKLDDDVRNIKGHAVLKIYLTAKQLEVLEAHGATKIYMENNWATPKASIELSGASTLEGTLITNDLVASLSGACNLNIEGNTHLFDIMVEGASHMKGYNFETQKLIADLSGGCSITTTVHTSLEVTATGSSFVYYRGEGVISEQHLSGGSAIIKQ